MFGKSPNQVFGRPLNFFVGKAHRRKQSAGVVPYVKLLSRSNAAYGIIRRSRSGVISVRIL